MPENEEPSEEIVADAPPKEESVAPKPEPLKTVGQKDLEKMEELRKYQEQLRIETELGRARDDAMMDLQDPDFPRTINSKKVKDFIEGMDQVTDGQGNLVANYLTAEEGLLLYKAGWLMVDYINKNPNSTPEARSTFWAELKSFRDKKNLDTLNLKIEIARAANETRKKNVGAKSQQDIEKQKTAMEKHKEAYFQRLKEHKK